MRESIVINAKGIIVFPMSLTFKGRVTFSKLNINPKK